MPESSTIDRSESDRQIPLNFDSETNTPLSMAEIETIRQGLKHKNFVHPREGELYEGKLTVKIIGRTEVAATWHWQEFPGLGGMWKQVVVESKSNSFTASSDRLAAEDEEARWNRTDHRGGPW